MFLLNNELDIDVIGVVVVFVVGVGRVGGRRGCGCRVIRRVDGDGRGGRRVAVARRRGRRRRRRRRVLLDGQLVELQTGHHLVVATPGGRGRILVVVGLHVADGGHHHRLDQTLHALCADWIALGLVVVGDVDDWLERRHGCRRRHGAMLLLLLITRRVFVEYLVDARLAQYALQQWCLESFLAQRIKTKHYILFFLTNEKNVSSSHKNATL